MKQKDESSQKLIQQYMQAKASGDSKMVKILEVILKRLNIKIPKI